MNNWRLTPDVTAIIVGDEKVYLVPSEKKQYITKINKLIDLVECSSASKTSVRLDENEFSLKISGKLDKDNNLISPDVLIKSECFPEKSKWYVVKNCFTDHIYQLLIYSPNTQGEFSNTFEAIFNEELTEVSFTNRFLANYKSCVEEFKRRTNCELHTKTRKFVPGRRYDSLEETRYVLCSVDSLKDRSKTSSDFITVPGDMKGSYLYVNEIPEGMTTVSEILNKGIFDVVTGTRNSSKTFPRVKIANSLSSMAEGESVLVDDFSGDIKDYWGNLVYNSNKMIELDPENSECYLSDMLNMFTVCTSGKYGVSDKHKAWVEDAVRSLVKNTLSNNWDRSAYGPSNISSSKSKENNVNSCKSMMISDLFDNNVNRSDFYKKLFEYYSINLDEIIEEELDVWEKTVHSMMTSFTSYYTNLKYFELRQDRSDWTFRQRVNSTRYTLSKTTLLSKLGEGELRNTLIDIANLSKITNGKSVSEYRVFNVGTKKNPLEYISSTITLSDIIKYKKGVDNMSESLKNEIIGKSFVSCYLEYDIDGTLE